jgi:putative transposase
MEKVWADRGYNGKIGEWIKEQLGWALEIVKPPRRWVRVPADEEPAPYPAGFIVLPRRWVIERTIAWIMRNRRMSRDYEFLSETTEALIYLAMIRLMLRRLANAGS